MARQVLVQLVGFAAVGAVLALTTLLSARLKLATESSRKLAHILLSHWILAAVWLFDNPVQASIAPACFIVINFISYKKGTFSAIEREEDNSPGTVWFAVSLFLLCAVCFRPGLKHLAVCGMLAMGYGDGFAALVGMRWGRRRLPAPFQGKTAAGCLTVLVLVAASVGAVCAVAGVEGWLVCAVAAGGIGCALELVSPRGIDNLTLPLGVAGTVWLTQRGQVWAEGLVCLSLTLLVLVAAYALRAISLPGAGAALLLGVALWYAAGWWAYAALIAFFVLGSAVSRAGKRKKQRAASLHKREGARGVMQVAANGLPALLFAVAYRVTDTGAFLAACFACLAAACADTFSSELGMLSRREPVSLLTFRRVQRGMSGGVSALGFAGAALGSLPIALLALAPLGWFGALGVFAAGVAGSLIDSLLGAAGQVKYRLPGGGLTERDRVGGQTLEVARGARWLDNDMVNLISGALSGAVCLVLLVV